MFCTLRECHHVLTTRCLNGEKEIVSVRRVFKPACRELSALHLLGDTFVRTNSKFLPDVDWHFADVVQSRLHVLAHGRANTEDSGEHVEGDLQHHRLVQIGLTVRAPTADRLQKRRRFSDTLYKLR